MKLATKLTLLLVLLSVIPLALVGYVAFENGRRTIERDTFNRLISTNDLKQAEFKRWVEGNKRLLRALARRPLVSLYGAVIASDAQPEVEVMAAHRSLLVDHLIPTIEEVGSFINVSILDAAHGQIIVSTEQSLEGKYRESEPYFVEGMRDTYVQNVYYSLSLEKGVMTISTPIQDSEGGLVAVLAGDVDLSEMSAIMATGRERTETEETYLVNKYNFFVTESRFKPGYPLKRALYTDGVVNCLGHNNGTGQYYDYRGVPIIGVYRWIPERELCILTEVDQAEAFAPIVALRNAVFAIGLLVAALVGLLAAVFGRTITGPLRRLSVGAEEVGRGHLDYRVKVESRDEVGLLASAFNNMAVARQRAESAQESAFAELEAFSYSVSHDLRAPLRAMDGFARILVEEHASQLSKEAHHYLDQVQNNAKKMGMLIDDLLNFARLGRQPLEAIRVSPAQIARQAIEDLRSEQEGRKVTVAVQDLPECLADQALLKQVYVNLIDNALKFTRRREKATIEVGFQAPADGRLDGAYFIKDNGVGFDMQYADKLFGIFQRLHREEDFEGTGVGLATVQRIIHRHGGRVWAEAEVDHGAAFYFNLGGEDHHD